MSPRRREAPWWGLLATLLGVVMILYLIVGLSWELHRGWDRSAPRPDAYHAAQVATPVGLP